MNKFLCSAFAAALLTATALPTSAFAMQEASQADIIVTAQHQKMWDKGSKLESEGLTAMEKAKKKLISFSADVVNAQNKRDSARAQAENANAEFRNLTASIPYFSDPEEAARWARQVDKAAGEWAKYSDRRMDGREELDKSSKKQIKAQAEVDKAQAKIDQGRALKAEAERLSRFDRAR
ncbi:hypothetical protein LPB140_03470 [Sphingorhabdus lutea]|uniref:DUF4398 domain-containing protein n=1 Tax=Sphingorhabdus lutea TaxID=1913578 RepID=A0A1L3JA86_9SPHN|nr:hypothetical protein [Sphingorhabdus lutea]APG62029.1 hypothetical protein LPB140_03470 [Sphingorhabdus lutea]